ITAIPKLLRLLEPEGALVSIDALGCPKEIAQAVRDAGADYLLQVKGTQPTLEADIPASIDAAIEADFVGCEHDLWVGSSRGHGLVPAGSQQGQRQRQGAARRLGR